MNRDQLRPVGDKLRWVTVAFCGYEIAAIVSIEAARRNRRVKPLPTLSTLCARHRVLGGLFVGSLTAHLVDHRRHLKAHMSVEVECE